jgi:hypothetical protein
LFFWKTHPLPFFSQGCESKRVEAMLRARM